MIGDALDDAMQIDTGMAFVIVIHLSPKHERHADAVIQRATSIPVIQVRESTRINRNRVYLISPSGLSMVDGYLHVIEAAPP